MAKVLDELVQLLALETNRREPLSRPEPGSRLGHGLRRPGARAGAVGGGADGACRARVHSLHAYFLRPGDVSQPIVYEVDRIRDGSSSPPGASSPSRTAKRSSTWRRRFKRRSRASSIRTRCRTCRRPRRSRTEQERIAASTRRAARAASASARRAERPFEMRPGRAVDPFAPKPQPPARAVWLQDDRRAARRPGAASVSARLRVGLRVPRHGDASARRDLAHAGHAGRQPRSRDVVPSAVPRRRVAPARHGSPAAQGARGLVRGRVFTRDGRLVASTAQEGLIRRRAPKP